MGRRYKKEDIKKIVNKIRAYKENIFISADIIVGFPGETKEDFHETLQLISEKGLSKLHIFRYSRRPGTPASEYRNQVQDSEKKKRAVILDELSKKIFNDYAKKYTGKDIIVLIEEQKNGYFFGLTDNYLKVRVNYNKKIKLGYIVRVKLTEFKKNYFNSEYVYHWTI